MKRIILTLFVLIALTAIANAEFYECVGRDGNTIITDSPPPGAKCESRGGDVEKNTRQKDKCDLITEKMSPVQVKKILGQPFDRETGTSGFSTIYFENWTYTMGNEDCIVRFQCSSSCHVIRITRTKN